MSDGFFLFISEEFSLNNCHIYLFLSCFFGAGEKKEGAEVYRVRFEQKRGVFCHYADFISMDGESRAGR